MHRYLPQTSLFDGGFIAVYFIFYHSHLSAYAFVVYMLIV